MILTDGFIKNNDLLQENSRTGNLINISFELQLFYSKLYSIDNSSLIGFIGRFGSGKSNFLNQIKNNCKKDIKWFIFDAWKYPERSNLWENFILEFARQIDKDTFDKTIKQVDGTINDDKQTLINTVGDIPGLSVIKNFNHFIKTTPAKRNFEVENLLIELIDKVKENDIYIIVEDIDRSGDNGVYFLETLNHFIKSNDISKKIIVIVPIGEENYTKEEVKLSYLKCLDYFHYYSLRDIELEGFVSALFKEAICDDDSKKGQITSFLEGIFKEFSNQITMRLLKHILRNANSNYIALLDRHEKGIDCRLCILFETARYIKNNSGDFYIDSWKLRDLIPSSESIFSALIYAVFQENHRVGGLKINNIYEDNHSGGKNKEKLLSFKHTLPIKLVNHSYKAQNTPIDSVLYYTNTFDDKKNYLGILKDYL